MSNPFAVLHVEDGPKRGGKGGKSQGPKLTPAEQKALREEREAAKARQQQVAQENISQTNFVVIDENLEGFIEVDRKTSRAEKEDKLSKEEFNQLSKKNKGELIDQNRRKGTPKNRTGGNKGFTGNRGKQNNRGGAANRTAKQNNNRGGNRNNNRGKGNRGAVRGENFVNPPVKDSRGKDEQKEGKYVIKKDRKPRNPSKAIKRAGGGEFNWDDPIDAGLEEVVEEVKDIVPEEIDVETVVDVESTEEWIPEAPEDSDKIVDPHVKRVGLSAYLASIQEEEAKAAELTQKLAATNQRKLDIVIPSDANLNKKGRINVDENDAFFFAPKEQTKKGNKQRKNQGDVSTELNVNFKIKKHRGYNMPRERRESSDQEEGNRGGNRQNRNNRGPGQNRNRNRGNRPNKKPRFNNASFPPLGGASAAPAVAPTWPPLETEQEE